MTVAASTGPAISSAGPAFRILSGPPRHRTLTVDDGRLTLTDAASCARSPRQFNLSGDVASLIGPFKAEGTASRRNGALCYPCL